jgi:molecular chaperone DnaK
VSVVGIDLGTTNTVVACVRSGKVHVLADERGQRLLPSVVSFHPNGEVLVGAAARARRIIDPRNTVYSHKRLIGRAWGSPEIEQARERFAFDLREGPGQGALVHTRGHDYTLPEISAFVLKRARQIAETALGEPATRAVITVPAHFNELQRASTKVAGRVSGVEVLRILNEPTAAALAYGLGRSGSERVAIYDFGGGTFDCTLLDLNGNVFEVLATAGDSFLGGDDIDTLIAERMAEAYLRAHRYDLRADPQLFERIKTSAEELKVQLSTAESHTLVLEELAPGAAGSSVDFTFTMTRRDLDALITPFIDRSFQVTQDALALARLAPTSIDKVILVGGSTRIPLVKSRVAGFFGTPPLDRMNPDEVVAVGAAIQAAALTEATRRRSIPPPPPVLRARPPTVPGPAAPEEPKTISRPPPPSAGPSPTFADFGAVDEPPSLHSSATATMQTVARPQVPSPIGDEDELPAVLQASRAVRPSSPPLSRTAAMPTPPVPPPFAAPPFAPSQQATAPTPARPYPSSPPMPAPPYPSSPPVAGSQPPLHGAFAVPPPLGATMPHGPAGLPPNLPFAPPVLVDVTPRALVVETAGGFTDTVVPRNAKIPCERTRRFATNRDHQTTVRVRVAQGEAPQFASNTFLGQVELSGLRPAPRGEVVISVTFEVDADGILRVRARDVQTGHEARAALQLVGVADDAAITQMMSRFGSPQGPNGPPSPG